jgi:hypothetical protein
MTQDRIAESDMDRPKDMDFNGWFKAAQRLDLNCLANEAFHYASRHPPTHPIPTPMTHSIPPCTPFPHALCSPMHSIDNPNTTQTLGYTKDKYNVKIMKRKSLLRSHQQPTKAKG